MSDSSHFIVLVFGTHTYMHASTHTYTRTICYHNLVPESEHQDSFCAHLVTIPQLRTGGTQGGGHDFFPSTAFLTTVHTDRQGSC
jgi:hypothetical protein